MTTPTHVTVTRPIPATLTDHDDEPTVLPAGRYAVHGDDTGEAWLNVDSGRVDEDGDPVAVTIRDADTIRTYYDALED